MGILSTIFEKLGIEEKEAAAQSRQSRLPPNARICNSNSGWTVRLYSTSQDFRTGSTSQASSDGDGGCG